MDIKAFSDRFGREEIFLKNKREGMVFRVSVGETVRYFTRYSGEDEFETESDNEVLREAIDKQAEISADEYYSF